MDTIYLDNAATTQPLDEVTLLLKEYMQDGWYNPSALYAPAVKLTERLHEVRGVLLTGFGAGSHKCLFTSGGTEGADTVILRGVARRKGMNFVCGAAEHPCVLQSMKQWEEQGYEVRYVKPKGGGQTAPDDVLREVDDLTALVSIAHVSNETGAKNDVAVIADRVKQKNPRTLFHADGVQAYLKEKIVNTSNIDYYTVSAHKLHALKGTGAVFYLPSAPLKAYIYGGGQESGLRSGTENTLGIFAFGVAASFFMREGVFIKERYAQLKKAFLQECAKAENVHIITPEDESESCAHIVSLSFPGAAGQTLLHALEGEGIYIANGAACSSKKGKSTLAQALSLPDEVAKGMVRVSFSHLNTVADAHRAAQALGRNAEKLRKYQRN